MAWANNHQGSTDFENIKLRLTTPGKLKKFKVRSVNIDHAESREKVMNNSVEEAESNLMKLFS
jgi:hypothetical protein